MPQPLLMHQIRRIIELHQQGRSIRQTERLTGLSRNTIREYLRRISQSGLTADQVLSMDDESLSSFIYVDSIEKNQAGRPTDERYEYFEQQVNYFITELKKRGVTRHLLWEEYRSVYPDGYAYSQFCEYLSRHLRTRDAVMHFTHQPGEQMQVDFAGDKLRYVNRTTGELILCEVLICVLPYSHYVYAEALRSQRQDDFITGLRHALEYVGGVPQSIKCDNMRTAVVRANRYEPQFTEAMEFMAAHYGTTILTARVRKPRDKGSVEKAVDLAYKYIYAPLRDHIFFNLDELNIAIRRQIDQLNIRRFKNKDGSRKQLFEGHEKNHLKDLPASPYEPRHVVESKVQRNYHVIVGEDRHQYSVPYTLIGKRLKVVYTVDTVEIYDSLHRVALHKRSYRKNGYTTASDHMPPNHRQVNEQRGWDDEYFLREASYRGQAVQQAMKKVLESKVFYEQTYNSCLGILRLARQYGNQRLDAACKRALTAPVISYGMIANILKRNLDKVDQADQQTIAFTPNHDQIRGPKAFE